MRKIERLYEYLNSKGIKPYLAERQAELGGGTLSKAYKDNDRDISMLVIDRTITAFPDLNREWLLTGKGEMLNDSSAGVKAIESIARNAITLEQVYEELESFKAINNKQQEQIDRLLAIIEKLTQ